MSLSIRCEACAKPLRVKDELTGKRIKCPACGQVLNVPKAAVAEVVPAGAGTESPLAQSQPLPAIESGKSRAAGETVSPDAGELGTSPRSAELISTACPECGRLLRLKSQLAGKRIKCPHCSVVQLVPQADALAEASWNPPTESAAIVAAKPKTKSRKAMLLLGSSAAVLLCGLGLWFFVLDSSSGASEQLLPGKWELDAEATRRANPGGRPSELRDGDSTLAIRARGSDFSMMRRYPNVGRGSTWKVVSRSGSALTLESYGEREGEQLTITPEGANQLRVLSNRTNPPTMVYKRK